MTGRLAAMVGAKIFAAEVCFIDWDGASGIDLAFVAEREFRAAGFETNVTADVDPHSTAAWLVVARPSEVDLWDVVANMAKEFGGDVLEGGIDVGLDAFWHDRLYNSETERL